MPENPKQKNQPSIRITVGKETTEVETVYEIKYKKSSENGFICAIPQFKIFFSTKTEDAIVGKADAFIDAFFGNYLESDSVHSFKRLGFNLYELGFHVINSPSGFVNMLRNKPDIKTSFDISKKYMPKEFSRATSINRTNKFEAHV